MEAEIEDAVAAAPVGLAVLDAGVLEASSSSSSSSLAAAVVDDEDEDDELVEDAVLLRLAVEQMTESGMVTPAVRQRFLENSSVLS